MHVKARTTRTKAPARVVPGTSAPINLLATSQAAFTAVLALAALLAVVALLAATTSVAVTAAALAALVPVGGAVALSMRAVPALETRAASWMAEYDEKHLATLALMRANGSATPALESQLRDAHQVMLAAACTESRAARAIAEVTGLSGRTAAGSAAVLVERARPGQLALISHEVEAGLAADSLMQQCRAQIRALHRSHQVLLDEAQRGLASSSRSQASTGLETLLSHAEALQVGHRVLTEATAAKALAAREVHASPSSTEERTQPLSHIRAQRPTLERCPVLG